jgi:hypothetical protein
MLMGPSVWILYAFVAISVASFISFLISPFIAWRKGFAPYYWMIACGPIGLAVICCLPSLKSTTTPEAYERLQGRVNLIGATLSIIAVFLGFTVPVAMWIGF